MVRLFCHFHFKAFKACFISLLWDLHFKRIQSHPLFFHGKFLSNSNSNEAYSGKCSFSGVIFCHFASAIVELQQRANTINIPKVKLETSAAAWRTKSVWSFCYYVGISSQTLTNTCKSLKYFSFQWCEFIFFPHMYFFLVLHSGFAYFVLYLSVNFWPRDWLSCKMEQYFQSIRWKWPKLKHICLCPVWKGSKVQRGCFEWHQAPEPGYHTDTATVISDSCITANSTDTESALCTPLILFLEK